MQFCEGFELPKLALELPEEIELKHLSLESWETIFYKESFRLLRL